MSNVLMDISLHADTGVDLSRYQFIREIINTSELTIFEAIFRWDTWRRFSVDCYPQSDTSDGTEQLASLFLILYSIFCPQWSASGKPWSTTDDAAEATNDFFTFLRNQEHGVNNERSQSIQSVCHSKWTHHMWPCQKDHSTCVKKRKKKCF